MVVSSKPETDITNRQDIELLVNSFYNVVKKDDVIGHIFHNVIGQDWSAHLPVMYQFWESVLLGVAGYSGNAIQKHIAIDKINKLLPEHYARWQQLWNSTVDHLFTGPIAEDAKKRAASMIQLIDYKVTMARGGKSIL